VKRDLQVYFIKFLVRFHWLLPKIKKRRLIS